MKVHNPNWSGWKKSRTGKDWIGFLNGNVQLESGVTLKISWMYVQGKEDPVKTMVTVAKVDADVMKGLRVMVSAAYKAKKAQ